MTQRPRPRPISHADAMFMGLDQARRDFTAHPPRTGLMRMAFRRLVAVVTADDRPGRTEVLSRRAIRRGRRATG